jgi:hypothetical protein
VEAAVIEGKGLHKLKAMRRVDADSAADPVADAETQALHRATREIRDAMAARAAGAGAVADADADPVADADADPVADADPAPVPPLPARPGDH